MEFMAFLKNCREYPNFVRYKAAVLLIDYKKYKKLKELAQT